MSTSGNLYICGYMCTYVDRWICIGNVCLYLCIYVEHMFFCIDTCTYIYIFSFMYIYIYICGKDLYGVCEEIVWGRSFWF